MEVDKNVNLIYEKKSSEINPDYDLYTWKKKSVLALLMKILYGVLIIVLIGSGIYCLNMSTQDFVLEESNNFNRAAREWNISKVQQLSQWKISLMNSKNDTVELKPEKIKMHPTEQGHSLYYDPLEYIGSSVASLVKKLPLKKKNSNGNNEVYNLTTTLYLKIEDRDMTKTIAINDVDFFVKLHSNGTKQAACVKEKAIWNYEEGLCYRYYMLRTLCIIIDQDTKELFADYHSFKCNGFTEWYESFSSFHWMISSYDPSFDDITSSGMKIGAYVSTNYDPYVWALYNGTLHFSNTEADYSVAGVWMIGLAIVLIILGVLVSYKTEERKSIVPSPTDLINSKPNPILM